MLNIGIDARTIFTTERTGIANYTLQLINGLSKAGVQVTLFTNSLKHNPLPADSQNIKIIYGKSQNRFLWEQIVLPVLLYSHPVDIYHATWNYGIPLTYIKKCVLTLHDVIPLMNKNKYFTNSIKDQLFFWLYKTSLLLALRKARYVITDSQFSFNQITKCFPWSAPKLKVKYIGVDQKFQNQKSTGENKLSRPYLLYFGGFEKRKNVEVLIQTFKKIQHKIPQFILIVVGKKNEYYVQFLKQYDCDPKVYFTDYITEQKLNEYLCNATLMIYPSESEGFGLPVLEAMTVGCPVITNKFSSIHEVAGDAVIYCLTSNEEELGETIIRSINDKNLLELCKLKGIKRARQFTWTQYIKDTLAIYMDELKS